MNRDKAMLATAYRYFLAVAEAGSIRGASDELNVAASAVNRQILQLEAALGIPLFERVGRGLRLSEAGRVLRGHLRRAVSDYQGVSSELDALRGLQRGKVSLATVESVSVSLLPEILAAFWATLPGIEVTARVASSDAVTQLVRAREADLGFTFNPPSLDGLEVIYERAFTISALMSAGHPLAGRRSLSLDDCLEYPIALPARGLSLRTALEPALASKAAKTGEIRPRIESNSLRIMASLARHEALIAFQTVVGIERELAAEDLVARPLSDPDIAADRLMVIHERRREPNLAVASFIDFLVARLNDRKLRTIWSKHAVCRRN
ncbi:MAG: LysR family transcriptional regulator [Kiloniellales bacterium]|nr:LysR family transcriptional regulator [Kiloniellales bacterium]